MTKERFSRRAIAAFLALAGMTIQADCFAGSEATSSTVMRIELNKGYGSGGLVFIKLSPAPTNKPCSNPDWDYTLAVSTPFDEKLYAELLVAFTTGVLVWTTGTGSCTDFSNIEALRSLQVIK